jgi:cell division cycle 20, cofactor of APC complex
MHRYEHSRAVIYEENRRRNFVSKGFRVIPQTPDRILDAPDLVDDFYLNLLDWSARNVLAVALSNALYLWQADSGEIKQLMSGGSRSNIITSVSWNRTGSALAVGLNDATAQVYDAETSQQTIRFDGHTGRIGAMSWNGDILATGSRDSTIRLYDTRRPNCIGVYQGHTQEVCGLKWSPNGTQLASGGNDNLLNVWDFNRQSRECAPSLVATQHNAAKTLKFWDVKAGELINSVDTRSQVCGAVWNRDGTEIVTSHGYSDNQLTIWKYPSLTKVVDLTGHSSRVLHLAASPDGETVVSAAGDETIRFWRCFAPAPAAAADRRPSTGSAGASPSSPSARAARVRQRPLDDPPEFELESFR